MKSNFPLNHVSSTEIKTLCKLGQGAECCRYLTCGAQGFECGKHTSLKAQLDRRVAEGTMNARGDNCPGKGQQNFASN